MAKNKVNTPNWTENSVSVTQDSLTVSVTCTPITVGSFTLMEMKAEFQGSNLLPVTQTFLSKSLYNLMPVVEAFMSDLETLVIRILAPENNEEKFEEVIDSTMNN